MKGQTLDVLPGSYTIARLEPDAAFPQWADGDGFVSMSRNAQELSVVCPAERVPPGLRQDPDWICYRLAGPFGFDETGVVLSVIAPLSQNGIGIFVVSTFDGDHVLIKATHRAAAETYLRSAGHIIREC